jgi:hypothetical protein
VVSSLAQWGEVEVKMQPRDSLERPTLKRRDQCCGGAQRSHSPVPPQHFLAPIAGELEEGVGGKHDGAVGQRGVSNHKVLQHSTAQRSTQVRAARLELSTMGQLGSVATAIT